MKYIFLLFAALLFASCNKFKSDIEFTGTATGISSGTVVVKNITGNTLYGATISSGKFHISKSHFENPGYYTLILAVDGTTPHEFDIYLEPGPYTVEFRNDKRFNYPLITSTSKIQNELSAYYSLSDTISSKLSKQVKEATACLNDPKSKLLGPKDYNVLIAKLSEAEHKEAKLVVNVLAAFVDKYPDNEIAPFLMSKMNYEDDPEAFYKIYQKFNAEAKKSDDGKEIGGKLSHLVKLSTGAVAPGIAGVTPDGKTVDVKAMNKKLILVEFWRAVNNISRENHQTLVLNPLPGSGKTLGIISVSFDTKRDWWLAAIKDDKLNWTQVSDLKGDDSPNSANWGITTLPTYYLLDSEGRIIERDIQFSTIAFTVNNYLQKHP